MFDKFASKLLVKLDEFWLAENLLEKLKGTNVKLAIAFSDPNEVSASDLPPPPDWDSIAWVNKEWTVEKGVVILSVRDII